MNDKQFEKMDEKWMKSMKTLREKEVSEGILKGFSASVERRLEAKKETPWRTKAFSPILVPALAVMLLASLVVLRSPVMAPAGIPMAVQSVDYAQLSGNEVDLEAEIAALKEIGAWSEEDDSLIGEGEEASIEDLDYSGIIPLNIA